MKGHWSGDPKRELYDNPNFSTNIVRHNSYHPMYSEVRHMNIIKFILGALGLIFGVLVLVWVLGFVWSILWYLIVFGVLGAVGYGGYKLFRKIEDKALGSDPHAG